MSDPSYLRETIEAILRQDEFQTTEGWTWLDRIWDFLHEVFAQRAQPQLSTDHLSLHFLNWVGLAVLIIAVILLLYFLGKLFLPEKVVKLKKGRHREMREDSAALKAKADVAARSGEYVEAVRLYYLAAMEYLQSIGALTAGPARSDRENLEEIRRRVGPDGLRYQSFSQLVRIFQEKWFGLKQCTKDDTHGAAEYLSRITAEKRFNNDRG